MIEFKQVTKRYAKHTAVEAISLSLPTGKITGIIGENGSGKSTLLKLASGLIRPTNGTVLIDNMPLDRKTGSIKTAYLSELDSFYPFYTVEETVSFFASQFTDLDVKKAREILDYMNLSSEQKVKHLSKGSRGRLKIALTLARQVPVILMDEPLSGLDPMVRESIIKSLISFIDIEQQTVLITTHEIREIEPLLDSVVAMHEGRLIASQDVETIHEEEGMTLVDWMKKIYPTTNVDLL